MKPNLNDSIQYFQAQGYNKTQSKSLAWAEWFESRERDFSSYRYDCHCKTCNKGFSFAAAGSVRTFIQLHKDHDTKTLKL